MIEEIDDVNAKVPLADSPKDPNIIFLQLESFFDVSYLKNISFSENPTPYFVELKEQYPSGSLTVPSVGAGTANTEFEVLTGMSLEFFGTGEYPYKTFLQSYACETVCYNLGELGYSTHAIHNHEGSFYDRYDVFSRLGFETFTPIEYMLDLEYNALGWAKDSVLTGEIIDTLDSTDGTDLIYTISVQAHGKYPTEQLGDDARFGVFGLEEDEEKANQLTYYAEELYEMDLFLQELITELEAYGEDVILIMFGDHLPNLGLKESDLTSANLYQTEYVIWSSFGLDAEDCDLYSYQLSAHVLELLGIDNGLLTKLHIGREDNPDYMNDLQLLQYDMVSGEHIAFDGKNPYEATDIQMGVREIAIGSVSCEDDFIYVHGQNFTAASVVYIDGKRRETTFIDAQTLYATGAAPETGAVISVAQECDGLALSMTGDFVVE